MVEHRLPKPVVAGSIPVSRSTISSEGLRSILFKTLRKNEPRIARNEEPVLTIHPLSLRSLVFPRLARSGCASMLTPLKANF